MDYLGWSEDDPEYQFWDARALLRWRRSRARVAMMTDDATVIATIRVYTRLSQGRPFRPTTVTTTTR